MEGIIVTLVDKYCATKEFFKCLKVKNKLKLLNSGNIEKESLNNKT
jgi:uncharacterized protein YfkK (UPF0435 family)